MRIGIALAVVALGCSRPGPTTITTSIPGGAGLQGGVVMGAASSIRLAGATPGRGGGVAVLACVEGAGMPLPAGGSLALASRAGTIEARAAADVACRDGRLVKAGPDFVAFAATGERQRVLRWARFDAALAPIASGETPIAGYIAGAAGRDDGALVLASVADPYEQDPRIDVQVLARDASTLARWQIRGAGVKLSQVVPVGDGIVLAGIVRGAATLDGAPWVTATDESIVVARIGAAPWVRTFGARGVTVQSYEPPRLLATPAKTILTWTATSVGNKLPAPDYDPVGGMPPSGYHAFFAALDGRGVVTSHRREPAGRDAETRALLLEPGGHLLEHRVRSVDAYGLRGCRDPHGCRDVGGPAAYAREQALVVRRRDPSTLAPVSEVILGGSAMFGDTELLLTPALTAVGTFAGRLDLPSGSVESPISRHRDTMRCTAAARRTSPFLLASQPDPDPCQLTVRRHRALFVSELAL